MNNLVLIIIILLGLSLIINSQDYEISKNNTDLNHLWNRYKVNYYYYYIIISIINIININRKSLTKLTLDFMKILDEKHGKLISI